MKNYLQAAAASVRKFGREEDGAQVIEYALIIAVVSIALVLALDGLDGNFTAFIGRVGTCLTSTTAGSCA